MNAITSASAQQKNIDHIVKSCQKVKVQHTLLKRHRVHMVYTDTDVTTKTFTVAMLTMTLLLLRMR